MSTNTNTGIEEKLLAVITESLPQAHVGILRDYLNRAAENEKALADHKERLLQSRIMYDSSRRENDELRLGNEALTKERDELRAREDKVKELERDLKLQLAQKDAYCAQQGRNDLFELCKIAFRNPRLVYQETETRKEMTGAGWDSREKGRVEVTREVKSGEE